MTYALFNTRTMTLGSRRLNSREKARQLKRTKKTQGIYKIAIVRDNGSVAGWTR